MRIVCLKLWNWPLDQTIERSKKFRHNDENAVPGIFADFVIAAFLRVEHNFARPLQGGEESYMQLTVASAGKRQVQGLVLEAGGCRAHLGIDGLDYRRFQTRRSSRSDSVWSRAPQSSTS